MKFQCTEGWKISDLCCSGGYEVFFCARTTDVRSPARVFLHLSENFRQASAGSEHPLVIEFCFGDQNSPLMQFLLAIFVGLSARFVRLPALLFVAFTLLRFKANFGFALFVS